MADYNTIESLKIDAGKRTYFLDVKQTRERLKYVKITESKRLEDGEFERHQILIFEEDIYKIMDAFQSALKHFPSSEKAIIKSVMQNSKERHSNAYMPWSQDDDLLLSKLYLEGNSIKQLMEIFGRNVGSINSRLSKLGFKEG